MDEEEGKKGPEQAAKPNRNVRADVMVALVLVGLAGCLLMLATGRFLAGSAVEGFILTAGGVFLGCFKDAFGFEFGSSRGSADKSATLERLASPAGQPAAAIATTAPVTVNPPSPSSPGVTVNGQETGA